MNLVNLSRHWTAPSPPPWKSPESSQPFQYSQRRFVGLCCSVGTRRWAVCQAAACYKVVLDSRSTNWGGEPRRTDCHQPTRALASVTAPRPAPPPAPGPAPLRARAPPPRHCASAAPWPPAQTAAAPEARLGRSTWPARQRCCAPPPAPPAAQGEAERVQGCGRWTGEEAGRHSEGRQGPPEQKLHTVGACMTLRIFKIIDIAAESQRSGVASMPRPLFGQHPCAHPRSPAAPPRPLPQCGP